MPVNLNSAIPPNTFVVAALPGTMTLYEKINGLFVNGPENSIFVPAITGFPDPDEDDKVQFNGRAGVQLNETICWFVG
jgi:phage terminase large subunit-like protein